MHRTKVKVVEDALDANTTIARANRADFDAPAYGRQPDERARRRQDDAARARRSPTLDGVGSGVLEGDVQGIDGRRPPRHLHVPVTS